MNVTDEHFFINKIKKHIQPATMETMESRQMLAGWGAAPALVDLDHAYRRYGWVDGKGQAVAIIDTGVDYKHPALGRGWGKVLIGGYDFVDNDRDPMDESGHGTAVAGVIAARDFVYKNRRYRGVAAGAKIVALRVADNSDYLPDRRIEQALRWVLRNRKRLHITAVNMSLGDGGYSAKTSRSPYGDELSRLRKANVFIAAASGNEGVDGGGINYPAADYNVAAVGSVNGRDVISEFTSRAADLDLLAPGQDVGTLWYDARRNRHLYTLASGTSFAAPFVTGAAVLLRQVNPRLSPGQILSTIRKSGKSNFDGDYEWPATFLNYSRLDIDDAIRSAMSKKPGKSKVSSYRSSNPQNSGESSDGRSRLKSVIFNYGAVIRGERADIWG